MSRVKMAPGKAFRAAMDDELGRVAAILGSPLQWSPGETELLATVERDLDRKAALEAALGECDDIGTQRALRLAGEIRLIGAQTGRMVRQLQAGITRLLAQAAKADEKTAAPSSVVSMKAKRAADTRWKRHRLAQAAIQTDYGEPGISADA